MLHTLYSEAFPWVFLGYAPLLGEIFQLQPKACYAYDHEPSCNTQLLKDPLLWRVSLTEDSSCKNTVFLKKTKLHAVFSYSASTISFPGFSF